MKKIILIFALITGVSCFASAHVTPKVTKTQVKQTRRIAHGVANGALTKREAKQLKRQQRHIQKTKRLAKADGVVTRQERAQIRHEQQVANRSIYHQKHDAQKRF
ncbi:MAG: hypothetical protein MI975_14365 [Cytophagales bacterium]|nr:hypothetical protein [Cytophagales bacterium]